MRLELAEYHFNLYHKPGKQMLKVDLLSRRADHQQGKDDNQNIVLLKPEHFRQHVFELPGLEDEILKVATAGHPKDNGTSNG